jgi:hypothetical protein
MKPKTAVVVVCGSLTWEFTENYIGTLPRKSSIMPYET